MGGRRGGKGAGCNELTIGLSIKSDHVSIEECHFDHQPVLPTELNQPGDSDENALVFCRAVVLDAAPWSACLEFVQNPVGSLGGGCTSQHIQTDLGRTGCAGKTMSIGRLHSL